MQWGNPEYIQDGKTKIFHKAVHMLCNSIAVICVKMQTVSFNFSMKINRRSKVAVVPVHAMKAYGGVAVELHSFLTSALYGASGRHHGQPLYPWERSMVPTEYETGWASEPVYMI